MVDFQRVEENLFKKPRHAVRYIRSLHPFATSVRYIRSLHSFDSRVRFQPGLNPSKPNTECSRASEK